MPPRNKLDKIFDNTFHESEAHISNLTFKVDTTLYNNTNPEDEIHEKLLFDEIHKLIEDSDFVKFNNLNITGKTKKLNKIEINQVYSYIVNNVNTGYRKLEIFSVLSEYFDIYPNKFYSSLSNVFKHELVIEIDNLTNILEKKKITKLF